ncbi:hypothetical protein [Halapricum sp. CBA1109]|nr:hypothetical protein [Halapricum sp. CBA1109]
MKLNRTYVAGVTAVAVVAAYSLSRWRNASDSTDERAFTAEQERPAAD